MYAYCRSTAATAFLAGMAPALAASLASAPLHANDRDLRATTVPASACVEVRVTGVDQPTFDIQKGYHVLPPGAGTFRQVTLRCPLPLNNIDLGGTTDDNDISKFRVLYRDPDGFGNKSTINVLLVRSGHSAGNTAIATLDVCSWDSNVFGTGAATAGRSTRLCSHDLPFGAFYTFLVALSNQPDSTGTVEFAGIDFPP